jgi:hypothetical protein
LKIEDWEVCPENLDVRLYADVDLRGKGAVRVPELEKEG